MDFKVEAHQIERLDTNSVAIFFATELKSVKFRLISTIIPTISVLLRLKHLVSKMQSLPGDIDIPESDR